MSNPLDEFTYTITRGQSMMMMGMIAAILEGMENAVEAGADITDVPIVAELLSDLGGQFSEQDQNYPKEPEAESEA
jgi:UDP-N-acetylglucosamine enolpyruvyl transferase